MALALVRPGRLALVAALAAATSLAACGSSSKNSASSTPASPSAAKPAAATKPATAAKPAATPASPSTTAAKHSVAVTLTEYKIKPAVASVTAGHVKFVVKNAGKIKHQFTVISTAKPAATALSKLKPNDDIPGARGEIASIAPGATKTLVVKKLKPGHYVFVCALPGHYQAGMYTDFTVK